MSPKPSAFLESIIALLLPYFAAAADIADVRSEIIETLAAYATRTRAEMLQAAQVIALGMTTLDVLAEARTAEMSPAMRIRHRNCANSLNRATLGTEKALEKRLAAEPPSAAEPIDNQNTNEGPAARITSRLAAPTTTPADRNRHLWAGAMMNTLQQMGIPVEPAPA